MPHCETPKTLKGGKRSKRNTYRKKSRGGGNILDQLQKDRLVGGRNKSMRRR